MHNVNGSVDFGSVLACASELGPFLTLVMVSGVIFDPAALKRVVFF